MTFDESVGYLKLLGVRFNQEYDYGKQGGTERHQFDLPYFSALKLPFTPKEWCRLCMSEGDHYIGGCCGTTGSVQSIVNGSFRDGGWLSGTELIDIATLLGNHDEFTNALCGFRAPSEPLETLIPKAQKRWTKLDPWSKIALLWHITKDFIGQKVPEAPSKHLTPLQAALSTLGQGLQYLSYERLFRWDGFDKKPLDSQAIAARSLVLARLLPALKIVNEQIDTLDLGPFEGFALIDLQAGPESVAENGYGQCLYRTRQETDAVLAAWREEEKECEERNERHAPIDERIGIRPVRVTKEEGLQFTGELEKTRD